MSNFDYTSRDYTSIQEDLLDRASRIVPQWTSRDASDFGMVFVDLWAYMGDILHYYVDRAAGESYLDTATQRESVLAIANLFDYIPSGRRSSSGDLTLNISNSVGTDAVPVLIPRYTRFLASPRVESASPVVFTLNNNVAITENNNTSYTDGNGVVYTAYAKNSNTTITVSVTEGERYVETYTANGQNNYSIRLANTGIVGSSIQVEVTEGISGAYTPYSQVNRLLEATSSDRVFSVSLTPDDYSVVTFGNGVNGIIPQANSSVRVTYRRSRGAAGNLPPYSINSFDTITLSANSNISGIVVVGNQNPTVGGSNSESMELMKVNIPLSFRTQDRAVSLQDYKDLLLSVSGVAKSNAVWNTLENRVDLYAVEIQSDYLSRTSSQTAIDLSADVSTEIDEFLEPRTMLGVEYNIVNSVSLDRVNINLTLAVQNNYIREKVVSDVESAILNLFSFDNVDFAGSVSLGTLYRTILSVPGVEYTNVLAFNTSEPDPSDPVIDSSGSFSGVQATSETMLYIAADVPPLFSTVTGGIVGSE